MSKTGISTADLVALTNETNTLITPGLIRAFNAVATPKQKLRDEVYIADAHALRAETKAVPHLADDFKRMLCMSIIERAEHGMRVALKGVSKQDQSAVFARARALSYKRGLSNSQRAQQLEQVGAHTLARIVRMAV